MFGYVRVKSAELKVKEYEAYRGAYCGLCRSMGKCTGQCSRMTLSYDFAFLVMLRICLENTDIRFSQRRCIAHPLKKRNVMERNDTLDYCARAAAILNYHKIKDDLSDERGAKKLRAMLVYPFVARARKKAIRAGLGELDEGVAQKLCELSDTEKLESVSVDTPAAIFGELLALIMEFGLDGREKRIAAQLGRSVGKWIYTIDALDDMREDREKGRYNPFLLLYGSRLPTEEELVLVSEALRVGLCSAEAAMDLVETDKKDIKNIIENILYLGMPDTAKTVIDGGQKEKKEKGSKADERSV